MERLNNSLYGNLGFTGDGSGDSLCIKQGDTIDENGFITIYRANDYGAYPYQCVSIYDLLVDMLYEDTLRPYLKDLKE